MGLLTLEEAVAKVAAREMSVVLAARLSGASPADIVAAVNAVRGA